MKIKYQKFWTVVIVILSFFVTTCRKDISVPNTDLEKLFGTWDWVQTCGGFAGQTTTPTTSGYSQTVEFNKNGIWKIYKDGKQIDKLKFTFIEVFSVHISQIWSED
ncbi:MAG: hypothetical protein HGB12_12165 [Bacteroidetes bacterium]|nr:hypothetical protein [Bacteroidota bacterium]